MPNKETLTIGKPKKTLYDIDILITKKVVAVVTYLAKDADEARAHAQSLLSFKVSKAVVKK